MQLHRTTSHTDRVSCNPELAIRWKLPVQFLKEARLKPRVHVEIRLVDAEYSIAERLALYDEVQQKVECGLLTTRKISVMIIAAHSLLEQESATLHRSSRTGQNEIRRDTLHCLSYSTDQLIRDLSSRFVFHRGIKQRLDAGLDDPLIVIGNACLRIDHLHRSPLILENISHSSKMPDSKIRLVAVG